MCIDNFQTLFTNSSCSLLQHSWLKRCCITSVIGWNDSVIERLKQTVLKFQISECAQWVSAIFFLLMTAGGVKSNHTLALCWSHWKAVARLEFLDLLQFMEPDGWWLRWLICVFCCCLKDGNWRGASRQDGCRNFPGPVLQLPGQHVSRHHLCRLGPQGGRTGLAITHY